ncbi:trypsin-like peptidase domain-containing protein [Actinoplanes sp. Pm04-4]|uniref:Trypsin-like peptidase domain-containing protein n=1 Tax=Paractinoplanes pyxinae TaxID=2997416 RepID=A0ABT4B9Z7_9ACTN|nr:trypsin-like peptidase domain-containing protein [Actinoplanes pyxinae]MCY1142675.1 trypsin-like peptidase domain-containing protein [Actinoplanes pyxinae]
MPLKTGRRKAGIAIAGSAALVLAAAAGTTAWHAAGSRQPVGSWHEAPAAAGRTPVAAEQRAGERSDEPTATPSTSPAETPSSEPRLAPESATLSPSTEATTVAPAAGSPERPVESDTAANGRQQVGELVKVSKLLGYLEGKPKKETFKYPGASYVKLHFGKMALAPGDYVTVSDADGTESYRYDAGEPGDRWAMSVTGDTAVLEVHRSSAGEGDDLGVNVDRVARGFSRTEQGRQPEKQLNPPGRTGREESVCGADTSSDAACYKSSDPVAYTKSKAIARLLINGTELCTGWRIGPQNRMLTNNHCFTTTAQAYNTEVWFNYQCAQCGGYDVYQPTKVWGSKVLATDKTYDYTLFSVDKFASVQKYGYLNLDTKRPAKNQELYVPQHPAGEPTRIAGSLGEKAGNCAVANPGYDGYAPGSDVAYYCDTEGGSSGSPVISRATNKVVALHHFGGCPNSGVRGDLLAAKLGKLL